MVFVEPRAMDGSIEGAILRSSGFTAGAAAQKSPVLTSTALQMAISFESPDIFMSCVEKDCEFGRASLTWLGFTVC